MIMDNEYDMCSYIVCDHTDSGISNEMRQLSSMTALYASPLFFRSVR